MLFIVGLSTMSSFSPQRVVVSYGACSKLEDVVDTVDDLFGEVGSSLKVIVLELVVGALECQSECGLPCGIKRTKIGLD